MGKINLWKLEATIARWFNEGDGVVWFVIACVAGLLLVLCSLNYG